MIYNLAHVIQVSINKNDVFKPLRDAYVI